MDKNTTLYTVDANGTVYYTTYYNLKSFGYGPGHVTSVTVDHNGSNYYGQAVNRMINKISDSIFLVAMEPEPVLMQ